MPEELNGTITIQELVDLQKIELPSRLRIEQRLGEISSNKLVQQNLVPQIAQLGGQTLDTDEFLETISERAEAAMLGMTVIAYAQVPKIINKVVEDDDQRAFAMDRWIDMVEAKSEELGRPDMEVPVHHVEKARRKSAFKKQRTTHIQPSVRR